MKARITAFLISIIIFVISLISNPHMVFAAVSKDSKDESVLLSRALRMFTENTAASELYEKTVCSLSRQPFISEFEHTLSIV